jgi:hypothetical protein
MSPSASDRVIHRPTREHTELEEELHEIAHIDYDRVAIVCMGKTILECFANHERLPMHQSQRSTKML